MSHRRNVGVMFDGTFDGFLSIVHSYFYDKINPEQIVAGDAFQQVLGLDYITVETDFNKSGDVSTGIKKKISFAAYDNVYMAFLNKEDVYLDLLKYIVAGFKVGEMIDSYEQQDFVFSVHKYAKNTGRESHLLNGFVRFKSTKDGVLYSEITPDNNVLGLVSNHFSDRLKNERWIIHDTRRNIASIYDTKNWTIFEVPEASFSISVEDDKYQDLWTVFYNSIAIQERVSWKRQRQMLPIKFRKNMTEFQNILPKK